MKKIIKKNDIKIFLFYKYYKRIVNRMKQVQNFQVNFNSSTKKAHICGYVSDNVSELHLHIPLHFAMKTAVDSDYEYYDTIVDENAFQGCDKLVSVHFDENIAQIGENSFKNCKNIKQIDFSDPYNSYLETIFDKNLNCTFVYNSKYSEDFKKLLSVYPNIKLSPMNFGEWQQSNIGPV